MLTGAALALESELWRYRTRTGIYGDERRASRDLNASRKSTKKLQTFVDSLAQVSKPLIRLSAFALTSDSCLWSPLS